MSKAPPENQAATTKPDPVTAVVWPWRNAAAEPQPGDQPAKSTSHRRGWIQWGVMLIVAAIFYFGFHHLILPVFLLTLSTVLLIGLLFVPAIPAGFDRFGQWLAVFVGQALNIILLVPFYLIVFGAGRLILLLRGKDILGRRYDPSATTYWAPHQAVPVERRYHRQF